MPTELLSMGPIQTMTASVAYALPAVRCTLYHDGAATFTQSNTAAFTASTTTTLVTGQVSVAGGFIKANTTALITLKRD